jgi:hypothetical protein
MCIIQSESYLIFPKTEVCEACKTGTCSRMLACEGITTVTKIEVLLDRILPS